MSAERLAYMEFHLKRMARVAANSHKALAIFEQMDNHVQAMRAAEEAKRKSDPIERARAMLKMRKVG